MSSPPYCPRYTLEYSDMLVSTIAPRTGPRTVPTPHMKHIRKIGGIGCIGLGSDFDGISGNLEMGDAGKLPMLAHAMEREGFTPSEIEAVFCKNVLRVYKEVL